VLGLTIHLSHLLQHGPLGTGLALAALLAFVVRPLLVGPLLLPMRLTRGEKAFVLWSGLKGAVPILLGTFVLVAKDGPDRDRIYNIIFVVVAFSVIVQGGLVPAMATRLGVPMRIVEPEPWTAGVRLRDEPEGLRRYIVAPGSAADGSTIDDLPLGDEVWISIVTREGRLVPIRGETVLESGDEILALAHPDAEGDPAHLFTHRQ